MVFCYSRGMYQKKLWKIEELWKRYYGLAFRFPELGSGTIISKQKNTCPASNVNLKDIRIENNSPFDFYLAKDSGDEARKSHLPQLSSESIFLIEKIFSLYKNNISLYDSDFRIVETFSFEPSKKPVHRDEYGEYFGLRNSQVLEKDGKLIYLFDNHNKITQPFLEYVELIGRGFDVVHIDAHDDDAVFAGQKPQTLDLKKVQEYIAQTRISDFFDFLSQVRLPELISGSKISNNKLIQNIHRYTKSSDFQEFKKPKNPYILSLDIDIFGPEGDFIDLASKVKIIAEAWQHADTVCIATSPGFIDQEYAQGIIEIFIE